AWQALEASLDREEPSPVVLQGDETERWALYARAITYVLEAGRQAVLVAPDRETATALADYLADRTAGVLADAGRAATDAEQIALWRAARAGEIDVLVGARSALFAPLARLGLIVVEREEDPAHKHRSTPRYHVRACAEQLARLSGCAVVFGAETPSVESFYGVEAERYRFVLTHGAELMRQTRLKVGRGWGMTRPAGYVDVVDLRAAEVVGRYGIVARPLFTELRDTLDGGAGAVLYVNRRGTAALTICRACGHVITCPNCSASMVQHVGAQALVCHSCNARATPPRACPVCGGHWLRLWGYGAEAVAEAVAHLFPQRRVARVDSDVPHAEAAAAVHAFAADPAGRVLVGTQRLLAFGARIRARLLGIVQADIGLRFPDFLAPERVFVTLMRLRRLVTGGHAEGRTIVQTLMPAHPVVEALRLGSYLHFFRAEIAEREREGLPPFRPLARAVYAHADSAAAEREVRRAHRELQAVIASLALSGVGLLGPAPAILAKQRGEYRWQILLLGPDIERLFPLLQYGWTIDADPIELT
ncbi:MAG: primosomal protein N', partial [Actinobacteria bacterium]|nr:primosomal protein N' [Actinomycetota bacterium]